MRWLLALVVGLTMIGCGGKYWAKSKGDPLKGKERAQAEDLLHSANIAFKFRDYPTAYQYYQRIIQAWPSSRYAKEARKQLVELDKLESVAQDTSRLRAQPSTFDQDVP